MEDIPILVEFGSNSTLIREAKYFKQTETLVVYFHRYYVDKLTFYPIIYELFIAFTEAKSKGRFYLNYIKPFSKQVNSQNMADKILKCKINVKDIKKEWLYEGEKGTYLNFTVLYNALASGNFDTNGIIIQDVPTEIYKAEKSLPNDKKSQGAILGNVKEFAKGSGGMSSESAPGVDSGKMGGAVDDDLPF